MNELKLSYLKAFPAIRTVVINNERWYIFKDICNYVRELTNKSDLLKCVLKDDKAKMIIDNSNHKTDVVNFNGFAKVIDSIPRIPKQGKKCQRIIELKKWLSNKDNAITDLDDDSNDSNSIDNNDTFCNENTNVQCVQNGFQIFSNNEFGSIRTIAINKKPWLCMTDVCNVLDIGNVSQAKTRLKKDGIIINEVIDKLGRKQNVNFINESNFYKLVLHSRKESAERFADWVTSDVLPTIRETGGYINNVQLMVESYFGNLPEPQKILVTGLLTNIDSLQNSNKELKNKNNVLTTENEALTEKCLEWADRQLILALVRAYATSVPGGYPTAWNRFKRELLYKHSIGLNARISNYEKDNGRKPKTLDMLHDNEIVDATNTIVSMCNENRVNIDEILKNQAKVA